MDDTRHSLLTRAAGGDERAWAALAVLYRPLISGWLRRLNVTGYDADDLSQDVLLAVHRKLPDFRHGGAKGAFRGWLRTIVVNRFTDFIRSRAREPVLAAGAESADHVPDPAPDDISRLWDEEHDRYILRCVLDLVAHEFEPASMEAFRRTALDGQPGDQVARDLNMRVGTVYVAKSRVLKRIRELADGLID